MTEDLLMTMAVKGAQGIGQLFTNPDDDWVPTLMVMTEEGEVALGAIMLPDDMHAEAAEAVTNALKQYRAVAAILIMSAWTVNREKLTGERPKDCDDREEALVITYADQDTIKMRGYKIRRESGNPPTLDTEAFMEGTGIDVAGQFADALRMGLVSK
jgi:hypothetical protein